VRLNPAEDMVMQMTKHNLQHRIDAQLALGHDLPDLATMPTRLIRVAKVDGCWRLRLEEVKDTAIQYCTLSYCWSIMPQGLTTSKNVHHRCHDLDFNELPKTIQDAVVVTDKLGLGYLWVDAICIIQEDDDKAREIAKMSSIYAHSVLTICASRALTAEEGFLYPRPQFGPGSQSYRLPFRLPENQGLGTVVLGESVPELTENRLQSRAWVCVELCFVN